MASIRPSMLSRAIIRSISTPKPIGLRSHSVSLRLISSKLWRRSVTSNHRSNGAQKISPDLTVSSESTSAELSSSTSRVHKNREDSSFTDSANSPKEKQTPFECINDTIFKSNKQQQESLLKKQSKPKPTADLNHHPTSSSFSTSEPQVEESQDSERSLPDLTQGIPSTLEYEATGKYSPADLDLLQVKQSFQSGGGRGRESLPASAYVSSSERKRLQVAKFFYGGLVLTLVVGTLYLGRNWDTDDEENNHAQAPSGWSISLLWKRAKARISDELNYYQAPAFQKLLPDEDPMFQRPYTLVLSLEDLLICSEWSREHGWRLAKRPGVDYFLRYLSQYFELVVFTTQPSHIVEPVIRKFDPYHIIMWPLFREATQYENGEYIKDLSYLNRDLSKVIIVDTEEAHVRRQPENAIILEPWRGDPNDKELISLIPFLEYIHTMAYSDVRVALKSFEGKHIPTEFARREAIARKKFLEELEEEKKKRPRRSGLGLLGSALGIKHQSLRMDPNEQSPAEAFAQGKMLQDLARERGQKNYELLEKEIRENGETWLKQEAALEEKSKEESIKAMKSDLTGWILRRSESGATK